MAGSNGKARLAVSSFRQIIRELRRTDKADARSHQLHRYIRNELRMRIDANDECKAAHKIEQVTNTNAATLTNRKFWHEVHKQYYSGGTTHSVEETAKLVVKKLPHDPNITRIETDQIEDKI